ncbi:MAG: ATP-binding protein [Nanobdellota archaeon]
MEENIIYWNPWWKEKFDFNLKQREIFNEVDELIDIKEAVFFTGIRRSGKTSVMYHIISRLLKKVPEENILYLNLDDEVLQFKRLEDILQTYKKLFPDIKGKIYVFLDEIQNIDGWERWVKNKHDSFEDIKFFISGSKSHMLKKTSSLLTGRMVEIEIYPLSFREFLDFKGYRRLEILSEKHRMKKEFEEYMKYGGFPEIVLQENDRTKTLLLKEYYDSIKNKDILTYFDIKESGKFERMSLYMITNISRQMSVSKIAKTVGLSKSIAEKYLDYSEMMYLFLELNHYNYSIKKQVTMPRKIYTIDTGIFNATSFQFSSNIGRLLENLIFVELKRNGQEIYYYTERNECDFVIKEGNNIVEALQICAELNEDNKERELKGLKETMESFGVNGKIITYDQKEEIEGIEVIPAREFLLNQTCRQRGN